jgi:hypothetical protein
MFDEEILRLLSDVTLKVKPVMHETYRKFHIGHINIISYTNGGERSLYRAYPINQAWLINLEYVRGEVTDYRHEGIDPTDDLIWLKMKV